MNRETYLQLTEKYERLSNILDEISELGNEIEKIWDTDSGKLFSVSFSETQMYIRKILDQFRSELSLIRIENDSIYEDPGNFKL